MTGILIAAVLLQVYFTEHSGSLNIIDVALITIAILGAIGLIIDQKSN